MATNTTNYGFKKPDESDFYDVADQNKNWDLADETLKNLDTPTFEDYTGSTAVPSATDAIDQIKSKGKLGTLLSNIKAAFKGACLIGHIVNNCVTDNAGLPLSAAQGKVLKDLYTQLYSEIGNRFYVRASETDFNNMTRSGYFFGKLVQNTPDGTTDSNWIIEVQAFDNNTGWTFQRASRSSDKAIFTRIQDNGTWSDWEVLARKSDLSIKYKDFYVKLSESNWVTSATGLNYFDFPVDIPDKEIVISTEILKWSNTKSNVTCSFYDNSYLQFRSSDRTTWDGTVRVFYQ